MVVKSPFSVSLSSVACLNHRSYRLRKCLRSLYYLCLNTIVPIKTSTTESVTRTNKRATMWRPVIPIDFSYLISCTLSTFSYYVEVSSSSQSAKVYSSLVEFTDPFMTTSKSCMS